MCNSRTKEFFGKITTTKYLVGKLCIDDGDYFV